MTETPLGTEKSDKSIEVFTRDVTDFLFRLRKLESSDVDCVAMEEEVMEIVREAGNTLMGAVFRQADETAPEVVCRGERWGARSVSPGTYVSRFGEVTIPRSTYRQAGRGQVLVPLEKRLGLVEGRYTPSLAKVMACSMAEMPPEHGEIFLKAVGMAMVSKSTLHRIPQDMAALVERNRDAIDAYVLSESSVPESAVTVQVAMDGVMVAMDGERALPRGRKAEKARPARHEQHYPGGEKGVAVHDGKAGASWHEASVATLAFYDANHECVGRTSFGRMPEYRKAGLAEHLERELHHALELKPSLKVAFASDGAPVHWEHLDAMQQRLPPSTRSVQVLDFWHAAEHLFEAAHAVVPDNRGAAIAKAEAWRAKLRHRDDGAPVVLRALRYERDTADTETAFDEVDAVVSYFANNENRVDYARAYNEGFPIGTGHTEAAAKSLVTSRMKRPGARYDHHGGQTILTFRSALMSNRMGHLMTAVGEFYTSDVSAA